MIRVTWRHHALKQPACLLNLRQPNAYGDSTIAGRWPIPVWQTVAHLPNVLCRLRWRRPQPEVRHPAVTTTLRREPESIDVTLGCRAAGREFVESLGDS